MGINKGEAFYAIVTHGDHSRCVLTHKDLTGKIAFGQTFTADEVTPKMIVSGDHRFLRSMFLFRKANMSVARGSGVVA